MSRFVNWNLVALVPAAYAYCVCRFKFHNKIGTAVAALGLVAAAIGWLLSSQS